MENTHPLTKTLFLFFFLQLTLSGYADTVSNDLTIELAKTDISCHNQIDGSIHVITTGGLAPFSYKWSNEAITSDISGLQKDIYSVTVTDATNCIVTAEAEIKEPSEIIISMLPVHGYCGSEASVRTSIVGGTAPYLYKWNDASIESSIESVEAGYYILTVTDQNGCTATEFAEIITDDNNVNFDITVFPSSCHGSDDASVDIEVTEGLAPFVYYVNGQVYEGDFTDLLPGSYSIVVSDANGCSDATVLQLNEPEALSVEVFENGTVDITVIANNGFPPYDYQWSNGTAGEQLTNVSPNDYIVTITDQNGCEMVQVVPVTFQLSAVTSIGSLVDLQVFPNPCHSDCVLDVTFDQYEEAKITIYNMNGVAIEEFVNQGNQFQQALPVEALESGLYLIQIQVGNAVNHKKLMVMH